MPQSGRSVAEKKKRGRKAHITLDVVKRVSERFGLGLPLEMALCLEKNPNINEGSWRMALGRNPEFVRAFKAAKAEFLEQSFNFLARHDDWRARVTFLERRHANDFAKPPEQLNVTSTIAGLPEDYLAILRDHAKNRKL